MKFSNALVTLLRILGECPLVSNIMDGYLDNRYQVLKRPSKDPEIYHQQKEKASETEKTASALASWLMKRAESTFLNRIEEELAEGYEISTFPVWRLVDRHGNTLEESLEPQIGSARRPWKRSWEKGMMHTDGKKWLIK